MPNPVPPPALAAVQPSHLAMLEGFDAVLRHGAVPAGSPSIADRVTAFNVSIAGRFLPTQVVVIMEHVRAAEANITGEAANLPNVYPDTYNLMSPGDLRWRASLSLAWDLVVAAAYGRWT